jgi:hypothetical protein
MKKEEFRETGKGNRKIVEEGFKDRIYYNVKRILVILIIISIVLFFFEKLLYIKEKNNSELRIGEDVVYKINTIITKTKLIYYKESVKDGNITINTKYKSKSYLKDIDKYMLFLLLNGYKYTNGLEDFNKTGSYEMIIKSNNKNKLVIINIKPFDNGYSIKIEKRDGSLVK